MRILLVEDHRDTLDVTSRLLKMDGHDVVTAATAAEAEALCVPGAFDVMICDLMLPDRDGWTLGEVARRNGLPAIAVSALAQKSDIDRSKQTGFAVHLVKPLRFEILSQTLIDVVRSNASGSDPSP